MYGIVGLEEEGRGAKKQQTRKGGQEKRKDHERHKNPKSAGSFKRDSYALQRLIVTRPTKPIPTSPSAVIYLLFKKNFEISPKHFLIKLFLHVVTVYFPKVLQMRLVFKVRIGPI